MLIKKYNFNIDFFIKLIFPFIIINFGNLINYIINIIQVKNLSIENFGLLNSYLTFLFFLSIPTLVLPQLFIKIYNSEKNKKKCFNFFLILFLILILITFIILITFKSFLVDTFNFYQIQNFVMYSFLITIFTNINIIFNSLVLSLNNYKMNAFFTGLYFYIKLPLILFLLFFNNFDVNNIIIIHITSFFISSIFIISYLYKVKVILFKNILSLFKNIQLFLPLKYLKSIISVLICQLLIFFTLNFDVLVCRKFCSEYESSLYNGATIISKIIFFLPSAIAIILMVELKDNSKKSFKDLFRLLVLSFLLLLVYNLIFFILSDYIIQIVLTIKYIEVTNQILIMNIAMSLLVLSNYCYQVLLMKIDYYFDKQLFIMIFFSIITYYFNNGDSLFISIIFLIFAITNFLITLNEIHKLYKKL